MCVLFTFCSLVLMAEGSLLESLYLVKEELSATRKKNLKGLVLSHRAVSFHILHKLCEQQNSTREFSKSLFFCVLGAIFCVRFFVLDFISWFISLQRGLSVRNKHFDSLTAGATNTFIPFKKYRMTGNCSDF